ncbi:UDP-N-acetylmuramoyl-L-alanine--D-glutamate ligase [Actinocorallia longicatena]|uniref:UDP-N-acetylmuramoylalanine--D-glutamate ligase n=1 Tax=Actinocorallia longicatena TaxID=111803 RepID=A0ABP6QK95_9ACTN
MAGLATTGLPIARILVGMGARVTGVDSRPEIDGAGELRALGVELLLGEGAVLPPDTDLVVITPGWRPGTPLPLAAEAMGVEVIGDAELAWRLRGPGAAPWLALTGTNGKTTVVRMLTSILRTAGYDAVAVGNVGESLVEAVVEGHDVLAVELSSFQLHWSSTLAPHAAVILNLAPDHLDWHGSMESYGEAKAKIFGAGTVRICNADDPATVALAGEDAIGFTLLTPAPGEFGVVEDLLVDRALTADPVREADQIAELRDIVPFAPHNVANALAAAALARAFGVPSEVISDGLKAFQPDPHRIATVATVREVTYVDDSKATNPHAAAASLAAFENIVWIAGGLLKGADIDALVRDAAPRLRAAVLLGADRAQIAEALARHAPNVPVVDVAATDTGAMDLVVTEAARLAQPGDTVLLAPAGASMDMFRNYGARGDAFAAAVGRLTADER